MMVLHMTKFWIVAMDLESSLLTRQELHTNLQYIQVIALQSSVVE